MTAGLTWLPSVKVTEVSTLSVDQKRFGVGHRAGLAAAADGVFHLTMERTGEISFQRRIQCVKLRSADHRADAYTLLFQDGRFEVARAIG